MARGGGSVGPGPKSAVPFKNVEPNRPIFDSQRDSNGNGGQSNQTSEVEGEEDEYDDEYDDDYDDEDEDGGLPGQGSFAVRLDSNQVGNNKNLNFRR